VKATLGMFVERLIAQGEKVTKVPGGWITRCPSCGVEGALFIGGKASTPLEAWRFACTDAGAES
jgi:hypothetical protein